MKKIFFLILLFTATISFGQNNTGSIGASKESTQTQVKAKLIDIDTKLFELDKNVTLLYQRAGTQTGTNLFNLTVDDATATQTEALIYNKTARSFNSNVRIYSAGTIIQFQGSNPTTGNEIWFPISVYSPSLKKQFPDGKISYLDINNLDNIDVIGNIHYTSIRCVVLDNLLSQNNEVELSTNFSPIYANEFLEVVPKKTVQTAQTITLANNSQIVIAENYKRSGLAIYNNSVNTLYISVSGIPTVATGYPIPAGTTWIPNMIGAVPSNEVRIIGTNTGDKFIVFEQ